MSAVFGLVIVSAVFLVFCIVVISMIRSARSAARTIDDMRQMTSSQATLSRMSLILQHNDPSTPVEQLLRPLRTVDPAFSAADFLANASDAFVRVRGSLGVDATSLPVTAAMAARLVEGQQARSDAGSDSAIHDVKVDHAAISAVRVDERQQAIDVRFDGRNGAVGFAQIATFVRPAGATSAAASQETNVGAAGASAVATPLTRCAQCGGEVLRGAAVCPYCGSRLDQTNAPWLLDAIANAAPSSSPTPADAKGIGATIGMLISATTAGDNSPTTIAFGKNLRKAVDQIVAGDPNFSQERFLSWATQAYLARHRTQGSILSLHKADIFCVVISQAAQNILVLFVSQGHDGKELVEAAIFTRPLGVSTPSQGTQAMPSTCASCGSPLPAGATICASCGTPVSNETGGWKLETVTAGTAAIQSWLQKG